jgi:hypothetical protein
MSELKAVASVLMYSGMSNPQRELTSEELEHVQSLIDKLGDPSPNQQACLGFIGYAVNWGTAHVTAHFSGHITVYRDQEEKTYYDTAGVAAYLCQLLTPVMVEHSKQFDKTLSDYVAINWIYTPLSPDYKY